MSSRLSRSIGPGLLWAAAAIGVSHLVQSTRAGADAGFGLWWVILLALLLKYPFFEYGPRYAAATGSSLVEGYLRIGRWALWLYLTITLVTAVIVQTAVVLLTAFLVRSVLGLDWSLPLVGGVVVAVCAAVLAIGRFRALDLTVKVILVLLALSTLLAALVTAPRTDLGSLSPWPVTGGAVAFPFLLALAGWMPSAIDISVWSSLWTLAKDRDSGVRASVQTALWDFRIGYVGTGVLAFAFLALGAGVMYGSGESFSPHGTTFAIQLVDLYARALGEWARPVVMLAAVTTMFSTSLTVVDGFPRAIARSFTVLRDGDAPDLRDRRSEGREYWIAGAVLGAGTVVVLALFVGNLTTMVDFATVVSFLTAPILGYLNLRAVTGSHVPTEHQPGKWLLALSYVGLVLLGGTGLAYAGWMLW